MDTQDVYATRLAQFRQSLYQKLTNRADTVLELLDALSSHTTGRSVVELSLNPGVLRSYSTLFKGIGESNLDELELAACIGPFLPPPRVRPFWLLGVDVTSHGRPFAPTLADRSFVYQPTVVRGNKPVTIGHAYSTVVLLPEVGAGGRENWVIPLATQRVASYEDPQRVGAAQIDALLGDARLPLAGQLCVEVADSQYSQPEYLHSHRRHVNLVTLVRVRSNRVFYRCAPAAADPARVGHPTWYGAPFALADPSTWPPPDEELTQDAVSRRGRRYRLVIQAWHDLLMRGKRTPTLLPMQRYPFILVRVCLYTQSGQLALRPLWLIVVGERRWELDLAAIYSAYRQRYDLEHFFRFSKQKLLLTAFQTPEVAHEEKWWKLVHLAYLQLWLARPLAHCLPRPWERYLPRIKRARLTPSQVQRDCGRIIRQLGTPAQPPKHRGNSPGRRRGQRLPPRPRYPVVKKQARPPPVA